MINNEGFVFFQRDIMGPQGNLAELHRSVTCFFQKYGSFECTIWLFNIATDNCPFIDDVSHSNLHLKGIFHGYVK